MSVDSFQAEVARIALEAAHEHGFALAGGNALIAHGVLDRPTEDVNLFSPEPGGPGAVTGTIRAALQEAGYAVEVTRSPEAHRGEFARLAVSRGDEFVQVDLARDWRQWPPVTLDVGPVLHIDDAVGSKVAALVGRGLPRDFIDVAATLEHYSRGELMRLAFIRDPGLRVEDFASAARRLDNLTAGMFADHGLDAAAVDQVRDRFGDWPRDAQADPDGDAAHRAVAGKDRATDPASHPPPQPGTRTQSLRSSAQRYPGAAPGSPGPLPPSGTIHGGPGFEQ